ncbi:MAG: hypothetical protein KAQ83_01370 [Nanoarchaeota archaeon]|nr:hypothetical protein [Nanoarchaeota archaeon]
MVRKVHTRLKRRKNLVSSFSHRAFFSNVAKKIGAKTFSSNEFAEAHAKEHKMKDYTIVSAKKGKRFKIVQN